MKYAWLWTTGLAALMLDQWTKWLVRNHLTLYQPQEVCGDWVRLTYTQNPGVAFSLLAGLPSGWRESLLISLSVLVILALGFSIRKLTVSGPAYEAAYGLVLAGAVGNLLDRIRFGAVIDFLDVGVGAVRWPVFNVADSSIFVGAAIWLYAAWGTTAD